MAFLKKYTTAFAVCLSIIAYFLFAYFIERTAFYTVCFFMFSLFTGFYILIKNKQTSFETLAAIAIVFAWFSILDSESITRFLSIYLGWKNATKRL